MKTHRIDLNWCKGCGICVTFCPTKVLALNEQDKAVAVRPDDGIACRLCELRCPDPAIEVEVEQNSGEKRTSPRGWSTPTTHGAARPEALDHTRPIMPWSASWALALLGFLPGGDQS